jgi:hypothetical protein
MADPRDPQLVAVVGRLTRDAQFLQDLFLRNYRDENNRTQLQSAYELQGAQITTNLRTLIGKTPRLKPALDKPNSAYNQFISAWNNGTGDLGRSFYQITEFWNLLQAAQPELNRLMAPQPGPGQPTPWTRGKTPAEIQIFTTLRSQTEELWKVYTECVATHTSPLAIKIAEHVKAIQELLKDTRLSQQAQTALTNSKTEWGKFISQYNNGKGINRSSWDLLLRFQTVLNIDCAKFLGS